METTTSERRWLNLPQAADYLGSTVRAIREMIWSGELPRARIERKFVVDRVDLDRLAEGRKEREIDPNKQPKLGQKRSAA